jgi:hypothetical protein
VRWQLCFLIPSLATALAQTSRAPLVEVPVASARYESLQSQASRFLRAVRNGDKPTLARLVPPASRDAVRADLENPTSSISRLLLTGSRAMRGRFMSVQTPRLTFFRQRNPDDDRVIVCFSDSQQEFKTPATTADLPAADSNRAEMCLPFELNDRQWTVVLSGRP